MQHFRAIIFIVLLCLWTGVLDVNGAEGEQYTCGAWTGTAFELREKGCTLAQGDLYVVDAERCPYVAYVVTSFNEWLQATSAVTTTQEQFRESVEVEWCKQDSEGTWIEATTATAEGSTLPKEFVQLKIESMQVGQTAFVVPWAMSVDNEGKGVLDGSVSYSDSSHGTVDMKITREVEGFVVDISECALWFTWRPYATVEGLPVVKIMYYEEVKNNA